ncbi:hypothetical protein BV898_18182 [Hypsibius exemplaris]|uniref:Peptidase S1 domain-containing protein n=1 Tax=Hypsibius exemplaris TaxID=2072580 RepID=A0A9X6NGD6_HYPEX|nr:hypothetical protein BV898_18182 [Hypsibius exemplaris]
MLMGLGRLSRGQGSDGAGAADDVRADPENTLSEEDIDKYESLLKQMKPVISNPDFPVFEVAIAGGRTALAHEFPFMVSLQKDGSHFCGGAILSAKHVIIAAHCLWDTNGNRIAATDITVGVGLRDRTVRRPANLFSVKLALPHSHYRGRDTAYEHDIAVLTLTEPLPRAMSGRLASRITLPPSKRINPEPGSVLQAAGWGQTVGGGQGYGRATERLQAANLTVISLVECRRRLADDTMPITKMCVDNTITTTCQGDSGGLLFQKLPGGHFRLEGITSYGVEK